MIEINIKLLADGINHCNFIASPEELDLQDFDEATFSDEIIIELTINKWDDDLTVEGLIKADASIECSCCLMVCDFLLEIPLKLFFKRKLILSETDILINLTEEDLITLSYDENIIKFDDRVRESLVLALPMKMLCREDCKGLCPICGINLNEEFCSCEEQTFDPRWSKLRQFAILNQ